MSRATDAWRVLTGRKVARGLTAAEMITQQRYGGRTGGSVPVTHDTALRHSAVWACRRLRSELVGSTPIDAFRTSVTGQFVEVTRPQLLDRPGAIIAHEQAELLEFGEWATATQFDLDGYGNTCGIIAERDGYGLPSRIDLVPASMLSVTCTGGINGRPGGKIEYRLAGTVYSPGEVWHERQNPVPGLYMGLSPVEYAAWSIGGYLSAQQFAVNWYASGQPGGVLRNTKDERLDRKLVNEVRSTYRAVVEDNDIFVIGSNWEWHGAEVSAASKAFIEQMEFGATDVCRFFGVPADMIDADTSSGSITYASITQRNVQLLVMNLGPIYMRREKKFSRNLPSSRFAKFNTDAILRMDPEARERVILSRVNGRTLAPSEARALDNLAPFTPEQIAEFKELFPQKTAGKPKEAADGTPDRWEAPV